ncbi:hypothetical protein MTO96_049498 [Rhipicephalus appendiculatus]
MQVSLAIDGAEIPFTTADGLRPTFTYLRNPVIEKIVSFQCNLQHCDVLNGGHRMMCPGPSLLQFSVISRDELRNHRFRVPALISFLMDGLHLPPGRHGTPRSFNFYYMPTHELDSDAEPEVTTTGQTNAIFTGVKPHYGPEAGGTDITLFGTNLDSGTERVVTIGGSGCTIYSRNFSIEVTGSHLDSVAHPVIVTQVTSPEPRAERLLKKGLSLCTRRREDAVPW